MRKECQEEQDIPFLPVGIDIIRFLLEIVLPHPPGDIDADSQRYCRYYDTDGQSEEFIEHTPHDKKYEGNEKQAKSEPRGLEPPFFMVIIPVEPMGIGGNQ